MFFLVNGREIYARQQAARSKLEEFLDGCPSYTYMGTFNDESGAFPGSYVLEIEGALYVLKKNVQANADLIKRSFDREVIVRGKVNVMKYKEDGKIYL